jgi:hypothetical protein
MDQQELPFQKIKPCCFVTSSGKQNRGGSHHWGDDQKFSPIFTNIAYRKSNFKDGESQPCVSDEQQQWMEGMTIRSFKRRITKLNQEMWHGNLMLLRFPPNRLKSISQLGSGTLNYC